MSIVLAGNVEFTEQAPRKRYNSTTGWNAVRVWTGARTKLDAFLDTIPQGYSEIDILNEGAKATVSVSYAVESGTDSGGGTTIVDPISRVWTLAGNDVELSLWSLPKVQAVLKIKTGPELAEIRAQMDQALDGDTTITFADTTIQALYERLARNQESYLGTQYVLRKTETVTALSQISASHANVGRMHNYPQLISGEPTLPNAVLISAAGLESLYWHKRAPQVEQINRGQFQIVQEYYGFEDWDEWIYDAAT